MTDAELAERLARLQNRNGRASGAPTPKRRAKHPALGSRIAAAGLGLSSTFGLVTTLTLADGGGTGTTSGQGALPPTVSTSTTPVVRLDPVSAISRADATANPSTPVPTTGFTHGSR